jgi:2-keto-myo-inositol isomerase
VKPALAQVCSLNSAFEQDIEDYAAGHCEFMELWLTKLEQFLQKHSHDDLRKLLDQNSVRAEVASFQGGLLASQGEARREAWQLFERRLALCPQIGIKTLIVACDVPRSLNQQDIDRVRMSLDQLAQTAEKNGCRAAVEFQAPAGLGNNLQTAAALIADIGSPHLGICLDAFHYYVGPSKPDDLSLLSRENLFHVQFCDLADVPREFATDSHRILPGDGDIPLAPVVARLREIQYDGYVSVEILNPRIWQIPPRQFGEIAMTALRKVLGLAAMEI